MFLTRWLHIFCLIFLFSPVALTGQTTEDSLTIPVTGDSLAGQTQADSLANPMADDTMAVELQATVPESLTLAQKDTIEIPPVDSLALQLTDSVILRSDYNHFGDILAQLPGVFVQDLGSVGQVVSARLMPAPCQFLQLRINDIPIIDPETGFVNMNLVPVEAITRVVIGEGNFTANTIQLYQHQFAGVEPKSRIVFRTGSKDYDDFDASIGMGLSSKSTLYLGGLIKNYLNQLSYGKYDAIKGRARYDYNWRPGWHARGFFYFHKQELEQRIPTYSAIRSLLSRPNEKVMRYDYGLVVNGKLFAKNRQDFQLIAHHARLNREFHDWPQNHFWLNKMDISGIELNFFEPFREHQTISSIFVRRLSIKSPELGHRAEWHVAGKFDGHIHLTDWLQIKSLVVAEKYGDFAAALLPAGIVNLQIRTNSFFQFGCKTFRYYPSYQQRFQTSRTILGNPDLHPTCLYENLAAIQLKASRVQIFFKLAHLVLNDHIAPIKPVFKESVNYTNLNYDRYLGAVNQISCNLASWLAILLNLNYNHDVSHKTGVDLVPEFYAAGHIDFHKILFANNLDLTVRLGAQYLSSRPGTEMNNLNPVLIPAARITGTIGDATLFFSLHNFIDNQYDLIYGYPMPGITIRWGVAWNFVD